MENLTDDLLSFLRARHTETEMENRLGPPWRDGDPCPRCGEVTDKMTLDIGFHSPPRARFSPCGHAETDQIRIARYARPATRYRTEQQLEGDRGLLRTVEDILADPDSPEKQKNLAIGMLKILAGVYAWHSEYRDAWII
jgi:hypothetical protein